MPFIIGRKDELGRLEEGLNQVLEGNGATFLISGEAGIGKTTLVEECIKEASTKDFMILKGWCMHGSSTPYMPVREALRSGNLDYLLMNDIPPKLWSLFLVTTSGILISKYERESSSSDSDIFTGMLTAVTQFIDDCIHQIGHASVGNIFRIGHGNFNISAIAGKQTMLASLYTGKENEFFLDDLESVLVDIENKYEDKIREWKGVKEDLEETEEDLKTLFKSEKYEGVDWARNDPKIKQSNMLDNITRGLARVAKSRPIVLFIDDLQWADTSTLTLIHYLARNMIKSPVLIIGTYRPEDILQSEDGKSHPLTDTIQLMNREGLFTRIELKNLKDDEVGGIIRTVLGKVENENDFINHIWKESQGNPLFVLELLNMLKDEHIIMLKDEKWILGKDLDKLDIPSRIQDVIDRRLSHLQKSERDVLETASVIGEVFATTVLASIAMMKRLELLRILNDVEKFHKLISSHDDSYQFSHVKIRDVLYNHISENLRKEYHSLIGNVLVENYKGKDELVAEIGYHYYLAKNTEKAVPYLIKAIDFAKKSYSNMEAAKYCYYALELSKDEKYKDERINILESLSEVQDLNGDFVDSVNSLREVQSILDKSDIQKSSTDNKIVYARMCRKIGEIFVKTGKHDESLTELQKGVDILGDETTPELGRIISAIGNAYEHKGEYDKSIDYQNRAQDIFSKSEGTEEDRAKTIIRIGAAHSYKGENDEALSCFFDSLKLMEKVGNIYGMGQAMNNIGLLLHFKSDYEKGLHYTSEALKLFIKLGHQMGIATAYGNMALYYDSTGNFEKAIEVHKKSLEVHQKIGDFSGIGIAYGNIGLCYSSTGDLDKAQEFIEKNIIFAEKSHNQHEIAVAYHNMGTILTHKGDYAKALEYDEKTKTIFEKLGSEQASTIVGIGLSYTYMKLGRCEDAKKEALTCLESSRKIGFAEGEGTAIRMLAYLDALKGEWTEAEREFNESLTILQKIGMKLEVAESYLEYGKLLKEKGDIIQSEEKIKEAVRLFDEMNLTKRSQEAKNELKAISK